MYIFLAVIGIAASILFIVMRSSKTTLADVTRKTVASLFFVLTAVAAAAASPESILSNSLFIAGAVCGMLGDAALDLKWVYPNNKRYYLISGFVMFMSGHLFYAAAIIREAGLLRPIAVIIMAASCFIFSLSVKFLEKPLKLVFGDYRKMIIMYSAAISLTVSSSLLALITEPDVKHTVLFLGAICFIISDSILCFTYFGENKNNKFFIVMNHSFYYAAQYLIAISLVL